MWKVSWLNKKMHDIANFWVHYSKPSVQIIVIHCMHIIKPLKPAKVLFVMCNIISLQL